MDRVTLIALLFCALGCVSVDGGAVEASWVVVTNNDGRRIADCGCTCPPIAKIRMRLAPVGGGPDPCAGHDSCAFSCNQETGATRFDIPPGSYGISLVAVGADGNDIPNGPAGTCSLGGGPALVVRDVQKGRVTQLDALVMLADCAAECGGADSTRVCTR